MPIKLKHIFAGLIDFKDNNRYFYRTMDGTTIRNFITKITIDIQIIEDKT